jgi:hypothetical protein
VALNRPPADTSDGARVTGRSKPAKASRAEDALDGATLQSTLRDGVVAPGGGGQGTGERGAPLPTEVGQDATAGASRADRKARGAAKSTEPTKPSPHGPDDLPLVNLPSRFTPEMFAKLSTGPGARPGALKEIDNQLAAVNGETEPRARFARLKDLQKTVDDFVMRYTKDNPRRAATTALKKWLDGAIRLREDAFGKDDGTG